MAHINNTLIKKQLATEARNQKSAYARYRDKVDAAINNGYPREAIAEELENEILSIQADKRDGEGLFLQGVHNAKSACVAAIRTIISELKGETQ